MDLNRHLGRGSPISIILSIIVLVGSFVAQTLMGEYTEAILTFYGITPDGVIAWIIGHPLESALITFFLALSASIVLEYSRKQLQESIRSSFEKINSPVAKIEGDRNIVMQNVSASRVVGGDYYDGGTHIHIADPGDVENDRPKNVNNNLEEFQKFNKPHQMRSTDETWENISE
jgi:hypothetical protein